jgi:opacity protein-like surface antigen
MWMMRRISGSLLVVITVGACGASTSGRADNLLGFYAGAGVGESTVRSDDVFTPFHDNRDHHTGWKAIVGIRPIPPVGAELEYIDFGHPGGDDNSYSNYGPDSHPRAIALFGVGHLPLPLPFIDIFGKAGAARLHTNVNGFDSPNCVSGGGCSPYGTSFSQDHWDTKFAYGAGIQTRFLGLSVRAEYERISSSYGDPDLFSVSATWTF